MTHCWRAGAPAASTTLLLLGGAAQAAPLDDRDAGAACDAAPAADVVRALQKVSMGVTGTPDVSITGDDAEGDVFDEFAIAGEKGQVALATAERRKAGKDTVLISLR